MDNASECANASLELLELVHTDWPLGVSISMSIGKVLAGCFEGL